MIPLVLTLPMMPLGMVVTLHVALFMTLRVTLGMVVTLHVALFMTLGMVVTLHMALFVTLRIVMTLRVALFMTLRMALEIMKTLKVRFATLHTTIVRAYMTLAMTFMILVILTPEGTPKNLCMALTVTLFTPVMHSTTTILVIPAMVHLKTFMHPVILVTAHLCPIFMLTIVLMSVNMPTQVDTVLGLTQAMVVKVDTGPNVMTSMSMGNCYLLIIVVQSVEGITVRIDTAEDSKIRDEVKLLIWTMVAMLFHEHSVGICPIHGLLPLLNPLLAAQAF